LRDTALSVVKEVGLNDDHCSSDVKRLRYRAHAATSHGVEEVRL
jgi:hypothetical protein